MLIVENLGKTENAPLKNNLHCTAKSFYTPILGVFPSDLLGLWQNRSLQPSENSPGLPLFIEANAKAGWKNTELHFKSYMQQSES